jgi:hypothetical protein
LYWRPDDIKPPFFTVVKANVNSKLKVARLKRTFTAIYEADPAVFDGEWDVVKRSIKIKEIDDSR